MHVLLPMHVMQYLAVAYVTADAMVHMLLHSVDVAAACAIAIHSTCPVTLMCAAAHCCCCCMC